MELAFYLGAERGLAVRVAAKLKKSSAFLWQVAKKDRPAPADLCADLERACNFEVRRWDLRPVDWHRIWPELVGTEGAPAVPGSELLEASNAA
jgi:DNA-binding transcriptional regulator YdaS (Cro superfamily)